MFVAYRIEPVVEYEGSDESRETERFSTLADAQKFWDAKVADARFNPDDASDDEDIALDCGLKLYWTLYGVHPQQDDGGVQIDEAIADRETEEDCKALLLQITGPLPTRKLNDREINTILHALRILQEMRQPAKDGRGCKDAEELSSAYTACDHFLEGLKPLNNPELDALCESIGLDSLTLEIDEELPR